MAMHDLRTDGALARPIVFDGPGESGGAVFELVSAVLTDLPYEDGSVERVTTDALTLDLDEWVGRPVVFGDGLAHDDQALASDPTIQGESAIGTVLGARFDASSGERIMRIAVNRASDAEKVRRTHYATSEAYRSSPRPPTASERADGITAAQVRRYPLSLALIHHRRGGRAGPRARVRTDGAIMPDAAPGSLDALMEFLKSYADNAEAKMLVQGWLGKPAEPPEMEMDSAEKMAMDKEIADLKADRDAQKVRADKAEAEIAKVRADAEAAALRADAAATDEALKGLGLTIEGWDPSTADRAAIVRADAAIRDGARKLANRPPSQNTAPLGWSEPGKTASTPLTF